MGQEALCKARFENQISEGKALLETDYLLFRGNFRLKIPIPEMTSIEIRGAWLNIDSTQGSLSLHLGPAAETWKRKIQNPPSRLTKLGVKEGMQVSVSGVKDDRLKPEIEQSGAQLKLRVTPNSDIILYGAEQKPALARLESLAKNIKPNGAIWIVYPKGVRHITELDVLTAIRAAKLTDVKVASFSPTHTALRAVIPLESRKKGTVHSTPRSERIGLSSRTRMLTG